MEFSRELCFVHVTDLGLQFIIYTGGKYIVSRIDFRPQKEFWFCPHEGGRGITNVSSRILILSSQGGGAFWFGPQIVYFLPHEHVVNLQLANKGW